MTDTAGRLAPWLADRYRIDREIGAGGMATVFLAHDLRHDRDVAIKVLHPDLGAALGGDRFLSEIRTTARLQHPHILPLLDSGDADGLLFYVMPFVTGETLRACLEREKQLPVGDAVRIAREVADALGAAHEQNIVHRDIKPENILLQGGHALVADFGIALAVQQAGGARMTQTGLSLGTPQYMSPEQAMGERGVDARSDIYALGAVTYEMLAGEPPFSGPTVQAIVAKTMTERPTPLTVVRDTVPSHVEHAVLTALAKLPADRFRSAAEFSNALKGDSAVARTDWAPARRRRRDPLTVSLIALVLMLALAMIPLSRSAARDDAPFPLRLEVPVDGAEVNRGGVLSPDGQSVMFAARATSGAGNALFVRRLDRLTANQVPGSNGAATPVFSPDGKWIAFVANRRRIVKLPIEGGTPVPLADVSDNGGIDWSVNGDIVAGSGVVEGRIGLLRVSAAGGALTPLTRVDTAQKELSHLMPHMLADGRTVLFTVWYGTVEQAQLAVTRLDDGKVIPLHVTGARALGVVDNHLVYVRADGMIMAVPFDTDALRTTGVAMPMGDSVRFQGTGGGNGNGEATLTRAGGLVYSHGAALRRLVWVDHQGRATPVLGEAREFNFVRLSPDGRRAAVGMVTSSRNDLWILDVASGVLTPLTTTGSSRNPVWSRDGKRVLYISTHGGRAALWSQSIDGGEPVKIAEPTHNAWNIDVSPDGHALVYNSIYGNNTFNLEWMSLDSPFTQRDIAASPTATEGNGRFSPDGRYVAYASDESGRLEIYVRPLSGDGGRIQISSNGGGKPRWSPDGLRLYYRQGESLVAATLASHPSLAVTSRVVLFEGSYETDFDVDPTGTRFLMVEPPQGGLSLVVIPNWRTELRRLTSGSAR